jgi:hypothetical protein
VLLFGTNIQNQRKESTKKAPEGAFLVDFVSLFAMDVWQQENL